MRAALGLALIFGGSVLALYVLSGRVPFAAATSATAGGAPLPNIQNPLAAAQIQHFGGMP